MGEEEKTKEDSSQFISEEGTRRAAAWVALSESEGIGLATSITLSLLFRHNYGPACSFGLKALLDKKDRRYNSENGTRNRGAVQGLVVNSQIDIEQLST